MKINILYIHGFNSAGRGHKSQVLQRHFPDCHIIAPTFNYYKHPELIFKQIDDVITSEAINMVVGTSLGGFCALYASMKHRLHAVVINPAVNIAEVSHRLVGRQENFVTHEVHEFSEADASQYTDFAVQAFDGLKADGSLLHFALSTDDELLGDHHDLEARFPSCHDFNYFDGQGHRFDHVELLLPMLRRVMRLL